MKCARILLVGWIAVIVTACNFVGDTKNQWGDAAGNRCVTDVVAAFDRTRNRGEVLGVHLGSASAPTPQYHWQGVQRLSGVKSNQLVISRSGIPCDTDGDGDGDGDGVHDEACGGFVMAILGTRETTGMRLTSNRLSTKSINDTAPASIDTISSEFVITDPRFDHAGGIQLAGTYLAVGLEKKDFGSIVQIYDLTQLPAEAGAALPPPLAETELTRDRTAGAVALSRLEDGRYLLAVAGWDSNPIDFYTSTTTDLHQPDTRFSFLSRWHKEEIQPEGAEYHPYQSINLVTDCAKGDIYLLGTANSNGQADLYALRFSLLGDPVLNKIAERRFDCFHDGVRQCDFRAAASAYVASDGQIYIYSTEYVNDGISGEPDGFVRLVEFGPDYN